LCIPLEIEVFTSFAEDLDSSNHKEWMDVMGDEMESMVRNEF